MPHLELFILWASAIGLLSKQRHRLSGKESATILRLKVRSGAMAGAALPIKYPKHTVFFLTPNNEQSPIK